MSDKRRGRTYSKEERELVSTNQKSWWADNTNKEKVKKTHQERGTYVRLAESVRASWSPVGLTKRINTMLRKLEGMLDLKEGSLKIVDENGVSI